MISTTNANATASAGGKYEYVTFVNIDGGAFGMLTVEDSDTVYYDGFCPGSEIVITVPVDKQLTLTFDDIVVNVVIDTIGARTVFVRRYLTAPSGIYIKTVGGMLYSTEEWDGRESVNGIAVVTDKCHFVLALEDASSSTLLWGGTGTLTSGAVANTTDASIAVLDYAGPSNTSYIIDELEGTNDGYCDGAPAAEACANYTFPDGSKGYLGAAGEWEAVLDNLDEIESVLEVVGGSGLKSYYWTSTQRNSANSWSCHFTSSAGLAAYGKNNGLYVRAFTAN